MEVYFFLSLISPLIFYFIKVCEKKVVLLICVTSSLILGIFIFSDGWEYRFIKNLKYSKYEIGNYPQKKGSIGLNLKILERVGGEWSDTEKVDLFYDRHLEEHHLYYNNSEWATVPNKDDSTRGIFGFFKTGSSYLDIGSGAGISLHRALNAGLDTTGVELNRASIKLIRDKYPELAANIYSRAPIYHMDGRHFLETTTQNYDIISLFWPGHEVSQATRGVSSDYLMTENGLSLILEKLNDNGYFLFKTKVREGHASFDIAKVLSSIGINQQKEINDRVRLIFKQRQLVYEKRKSYTVILIIKKGIVTDKDDNKFQEVLAGKGIFYISRRSQVPKYVSTIAEKTFDMVLEQRTEIVNDERAIYDLSGLKDRIYKNHRWFSFLLIVFVFFFFKSIKADKKFNQIHWKALFSGTLFGANHLVISEFGKFYFGTPLTLFVLLTLASLSGALFSTKFLSKKKINYVISWIVSLTPSLFIFTITSFNYFDTLFEKQSFLISMLILGFISGSSLNYLFMSAVLSSKEGRDKIYSQNNFGFFIGTLFSYFIFVFGDFITLDEYLLFFSVLVASIGLFIDYQFNRKRY